jgi:hypothetical protein
VLENKNVNYLKSENSIYFPNLSSLMKISLGLIFFTIFSTALVYAQSESETETIFTIDVIENAYLKNNFRYFDTTIFSAHPGASIILTNNDVVSHNFISGSSNAGSNNGNINYDEFLVCELGESVLSNSNEYSDDIRNLCTFNKDNRIITDIISPGESVTILIDDVGTYRIIDPDYPWMEFLVYVFPKSSSSQNEVNEQIPISEPIIAIPSTVQTLSINVDGVSYDVEYVSEGLTVMDIESDLESKSLIFSVNVIDLTGKLDVTFDRFFFDSVYDGVDDLFFILSDGDETVFTETQTTSTSRTLSIDIPFGTEELEIIGSVFGISKEIISIPSISTSDTSVIETPVIETPVIETPVIETPVIETPVIETSSTNECGPGTILENDVCILDQRCGPGTILENDVCILDSTPTKSSSSGNGKELIMGLTIAFVLAGIVGIIFAIISKASRNKN